MYLKYGISYLKMKKILIYFAMYLSALDAYAVDTYNNATNQLFIPSVLVGSNIYTNVSINVDKVISVNQSSPNGIMRV